MDGGGLQLRATPRATAAAASPSSPASVPAASVGEGLAVDLDVDWAEVDTRRYLVFSSALVLSLDFAVFPLDLLKTRQQYDTAVHARRASPTSLSALTRHILRTEGLRGLYRGAVVSNVGSWPGQLLYFGSYELVRARLEAVAERQRRVPNSRGRVDFGINLVAGFCADVLSLLGVCPAEVVSQRVMVATHVREQDSHGVAKPRTTAAVVRSIFHTDGLRGFYRGFGASVATYGPSSAVWFATYEWNKRRLGARAAGRDIGDPRLFATKVHMASGALAGLAGGLVMNPFEVVKTRLQTLDARHAADAELLRKGYVGLFRWTVQREGVMGLSRGLVPRLAFAIPASSVTFAAYELAKNLSLKRPAGP